MNVGSDLGITAAWSVFFIWLAVVYLLQERLGRYSRHAVALGWTAAVGWLAAGVWTLNWQVPLPTRSHPIYLGCLQNLRQIQAAKEQWALENKTIIGDAPNVAGVNQFLKNSEALVCPLRGAYFYNAIGTDPTCTLGSTLPGHSMDPAVSAAFSEREQVKAKRVNVALLALVWLVGCGLLALWPRPHLPGEVAPPSEAGEP